MPQPVNTPLVLVVRDGWGENPHREHDAFNAVRLARTPVDDRLRRAWPWTLIRTSGEDVGLPEGTMGNSEVGHQNLGAGRVVYQESVRITRACRGEGPEAIRRNAVLLEAVARARERGRPLHLMGIASDAGVHGLLAHLYALLELCRETGHRRAAVHLFTDGRDTGPFTGAGYVAQAQRRMEEIGVGSVASVMGRYWAMDRDGRWERVERAYACLTGRDADRLRVGRASSALEAVHRYYQHPEGETLRGDEFITPTMIGSPDEAAQTRIRDGDAVIFYNYRGDRPRELVAAFVLPDEAWSRGLAAMRPGVVDALAGAATGRRPFDRGSRLELHFVTMTVYAEELSPFVRVAFPKPPKMVNIMGEYLSRLGLTQFRCAETEKYPHVTFFFNDYRDEPFPGEHRENPPSPRVPTYDLKPEMSAYAVRDAVLRRLAAPDCEHFFVVNFANGDMVGHTGVLSAAVRAIEVVDACVGAIVEATLARGGSLIVTADHGNAEQMWDPAANAPHTAHTLYDVPLYIVGERFRGRPLAGGGRLADVAPTALDMMGLPLPPEMTGRVLWADGRESGGSDP